MIPNVVGRTSPTPAQTGRTKAGNDALDLAKHLAETPPAARPATVAAVASHLTPVQRGQLLRAIDAHSPGPIDDICNLAQTIIDAVKGIVNGAVKTAKNAGALGIGKLPGADTAELAAKSPSLSSMSDIRIRLTS